MAETVLKGLECSERELSILLTDDQGIRELNKQYRGIDQPTDVLSFPMNDQEMLGDVAISIETAVSQAEQFKVNEDEELARLLVHGILHLLGYDHVHGGRQAKKMKDKECEALEELRSKGLC